MRSPVGANRRLDRVEIENGLIAYRCSETGGHWISSTDYWRWQHSQPIDKLPLDEVPEDHPVSELDDVVKLCPESGTIMVRYRVGHGLNFRVERSVTGGFWLDGGEWELLRSGNLHRSLHLIFTAPWQRALRDKGREEVYEAMLEKRLGSDLFARLKSLRDDLSESPDREIALAFLQRGPS